MSHKTELLLLLSKQQGQFLSNDEGFKIISNYQELMQIISEIIEETNENIFEFLYSYKTLVHSNILYNEEASINIEDFNLKNEFAEYYYLDLLIMDKEEIVNYEYDFNFLKNMNELYKKITLFNNANRLQKIVNSKIFLDIINNFCGTDNYDEELNDNDINKFKNETDNVILDNINIFKELDLDINIDNINSIKLDNLYGDILISLIKHGKFSDYNYVYSILQELSLENIRLNSSIINSLKEALDKSNDFMKQYLIKSRDDLSNETKINFYYILFKEILKDKIYIYQFNFLLETRSIILNMIKLNKVTFKNLKKEFLERLKYVLETFCDSEYYFKFEEEGKEEIKQLKEILNWYQLYFFESKKKEIEEIKEHIKNKNVKSPYLKDYEKAVLDNNFYPIIKSLYYSVNNIEIDNEKNLRTNYKNWDTIYTSIKNCKLKKLKKKDLMYKLITDEKYKEYFSKIFTQEEINSFINHVKGSEKEKEKKVQKLEKKDSDETLGAPEQINPNNFKNDITPNPNNDNNSKTPKYYNIINNDNDKDNNANQNKKVENNNYLSKAGTPEGELYDKIVKPNSDINNYIKDDNYINLAQGLLKRCYIELTVKKNGGENFITLDKVLMDSNNLTVIIDKFNNFCNTSICLQDTDDEIRLNSHKLVNFIQEFKKRIMNEFSSNYCLKLSLELENKDQLNDNNLYNIDAIYSFKDPIKNNEFTYKEENVLIYGTDSNLQGFNFMMFDINQERYKFPMDIDLINDNFENKNNDNHKNEISIDNNSNKSNSNSFLKLPDIYEKASEINILEIIKIIENKSSFNGFIKELNNGYFIYVKSDNSLQLLDNNYNPVKEIKDYRVFVICCQ